ncbi:prolyl aminopeptidase [Thioflexithrix psekupsensis]|uniref:Proline iminopeptidase n=1 Tax=Thioflexithrix psekupsensis TaxID=1570016 RepID=A0A251X7D0_9GAMM|nr:prolyl aminopeptidase [Thioflexithrix psekupsensis]OUD13371.1 prolyl aminopeptidase [Thioflexithrix psekupsensis]
MDDVETLLFPEISPYAIHDISTTAPHRLRVEESGNAQGIPIVFLHGGPGSHCKAYHRCFFNPLYYRIILFDQRGSGTAQPQGELRHNNTSELIQDLEKIREYLGISQWVLFGGSWGSTLALLYAQDYPHRVLGLILRGIFLARQQDIDWVYRPTALLEFFPQQWQDFTAWLPKAARQDPLPYYYHCLTGDDIALAQQAALQWSAWGACVVSFGTFLPPNEFEPELLMAAKIESHYMMNRCFLQENQILRNMESLQSIPSMIIHGQQDLICPLNGAWQLHQSWKNSTFHCLPNSGHLAHYPEMQRALITATETMAQQLFL